MDKDSDFKGKQGDESSNVVSIVQERVAAILSQNAGKLNTDAKKMMEGVLEQMRDIDVEDNPTQLAERIHRLANRLVQLVTEAETRHIAPEELADNAPVGEMRTIRPSSPLNYVPVTIAENIGDLIEQAENEAEIVRGLARVNYTPEQYAKYMKSARDKIFKAAQEAFLLMMRIAREQKPPPNTLDSD